MERRAYPSDLSDRAYLALEPYLPTPQPRGRPWRWPLREILDAIFSVIIRADRLPRRAAAPVGSGTDRLVAGPEPPPQQGLRASVLDQRSPDRRDHDPPDGAAPRENLTVSHRL